MALQSQAPRAGVSRRYVASSRRKKSLAPWLALLGLAVIVGGLIWLFSGPEPTETAANPVQPDTDSAAPDTGSPAVGASTTSPPPISSRPATSGTATTPRDSTTTAATTAAPPTTGGTRPPARPVQPRTGSDSTPLVGETKDQYELGMQRLEAGDVVSGRALLSELLFREGALPRHEAQAVRERLTFLSQSLVFSKTRRPAEQVASDPVVALHKVQSGEYLSTIGNTYRTPYQLIERINNVQARRLQAGQTLQVIKGPVHARIDKSDYRMDLFVYDDEGIAIYLKSYTVGLGEFDSTPVGMWRVKPGSKVGPANGGPSWRNPRTGKVYDRNDPDIPIGEYWMALEGTDDNTKDKAGYGIHATNDPASIGRQESMGCIRMRDKDVDEVFYTLFEGASTVEIQR